MPDDAATTVDVLVVGAGPAGTAAAMLLARAGRSVMLIDKALFPRDKCCGDGLTTLALRELEALGLQPDRVPNWRSVDSAWLRSPSGREVRLPLPSDGIYAATTPRRELDTALLQLARDAGATVCEGASLEGVRQSAGRVDAVVAGRGTVTARYVVAADGAWSPTRRLLGLSEPGYLGEWHAFRQYARHVNGPAAARLYVWFEEDLLPGYAWSFPLPDGRVNLGFGVMRGQGRPGTRMKSDWAGLIERPHIRAALGPDAELEDRAAAWPIPAAIDRAVLTAGRVLFVGDAARAADVMTGEGIGQALETGRLAAEAIICGGPATTPAAVGAAAGAVAATSVTAAYERAVRRHLLADHRMSRVLNLLLSKPLLARGAVRVVGLTAWTRRNFARWMFEDEPRAVVLTPRRWHRHFLHRPGPYRHPT